MSRLPQIATALAGENTLLIAYLFPPAGGVGVQRAISYAKYLGDAGCPLTVLTTRNPVTAWLDPALLDSIPKNVAIERAITPEPPYPIRHWVATHIIPKPPVDKPSNPSAQTLTSNGGLKTGLKRKLHEFLSPDPQRFWVPFALRKATRLIEERNIRNVLVTTPPFSTLEVGIRLKQRFPHLTLISEFRDEWLGYYLSLDPNQSPVRRAIAAELESRAVAHSDAVIMVTAAWRDAIRNRYPSEPDSKFHHIPNGYDPAMYRALPSRRRSSGKLVIAYTGTVYWNQVYSPKPLLDALTELTPAERDVIELHFVGRVVDEAAPHLADAPVRVVTPGFVPQQQALEAVANADCALVIMNNAGVQSGKLFEYLPTGKPILVISRPGGQIAQLIEETQTGWCIDAADRAGLVAALRRLIAIFVHNQPEHLPNRNQKAIESYARPNLVAAMTRAAAIGAYRAPASRVEPQPANA